MEKITDRDIQEIQKEIKDIVADETQSIDSRFDLVIDNKKTRYEIVHKIDGTTQALALAPIVNG